MQRPSIPPRFLGVLEASCIPPHGAQQSTTNVGSPEESKSVPNGVIPEPMVDRLYWSRPGAVGPHARRGLEEGSSSAPIGGDYLHLTTVHRTPASPSIQPPGTSPLFQLV
ncbi:hypothetical protein JI435_432410 [Parastagonospora nodorum SN15]|uniref:Uncharacterized protein n=1 Tax=Phaeosphaeria nodorum (strain SN15 / ATCC MYA-4574 / FGSC 10173) TaxID=321614 RepID=A0A7U2I0P5_PHANO|nr:hypothetical protein HBI70_102350 [Parastagonospora nodorum]QRC95536.1 hypothetical protein JI435_432410 [Parastagonospora nodorum SN15]KAH5315020.1 hypothetical protein HBI12_131400 [Parastagonospora nodorum]KAH5391435.1 hypothetical protein HBI33_020170 [Parastagonospora nodorum]KAH6040371.1 hypothetical protein HBI82_001560 [Parastagonospora nodorum]